MNIRLKEFEIKAIIESFTQTFMPDDNLWIFGSRADPNQRGGDIDLYVETKMDGELAFTAKLAFANLICDKIGEQKIDIVLNLRNTDYNLPIYEKALNEGVKLV